MGDGNSTVGGQSYDALFVELEARGVDVVHLGIFDIDCVLRERRFGLAQARRFLENDPTFVNVLHKWDIADSVTADGPFVGEPIAVDTDSVRSYPFEAGSALLLADYAGPSRGMSARELLRGQIDKARARGFTIKAAFEFEFILLAETPETLRRKNFDDLDLFAPDNKCWSGLSSAVHSDLLSGLSTALEGGGIGVEALGMELGPGCLEATLTATEPLAAADEAALFRLYTKAFCRSRDMTASFMAQLGGEAPGLSGHLHLSLCDEEGRNLFYDAAAENNMSPAFQNFVGGVTRHTPDLLALTAHTVNAYRRLTPGNWAPRTATWAVQNYASAVRVVPGPEPVCRMEFRLSASDTNPYLTLAMILAAGLDGIENRTALPAPMEGGGPDDTPDDMPALPHDLFEAAGRLSASSTARQAFGDRFIDHFVKGRLHEEAALRRHVSGFERARYLEAI